MKHVSLGRLDVSRLGLGCMGMSAYYTGAGIDDAESIRTIHRALDLGITFIDTAEVYGPYTNEERSGAPSPAGATRWSRPPSSGSSPTATGTRSSSTAPQRTSASPETIRRAHAVHPLTALQHWTLIDPPGQAG